MSKPNPISSALAVMLIASLACVSSPAIPTMDSNMIGTAIAQTAVAAQTQTGQSVVSSRVNESTSTPEFPTPTFTQTVSPTSAFTETPTVPQISVLVATNCRVGPGKVYAQVGMLLVGEVAEVFGVDPTGNYWYIRNPDNPNGYCWVWGEYATVVGNAAVLPIFTPPPTPTVVPAFEASFKKLETCSGSWWVDLELKNTGGVTFKSVSITLRDTTTGMITSLTTDGFTDRDGCATSSSKDSLPAGGAQIVSVSPFVYDPTGHELRATITVCTEKGNSGACMSQVINFKP